MLKVFAADKSDLDWMLKLYRQAAAAGHFMYPDNKQGRALLKRNLLSIIEQNTMIDYDIRAQAMVFENNQERIGYVCMSEIKAGLGGNEIHLFMVDNKFRGQGYGKLMLEEIIHRWHDHADIYARCFPASASMKHLLLHANFTNEGQTTEGSQVYRLVKTASLPEYV